MDDIVEKHRKRLARAEKKLFRELNKSYRLIERELTKELADILATSTGTPAQIMASQRVRSLLQQVRTELQRYATTALKPAIEGQMVQAALWGAEQAQDLLKAVLPETVPIATLPTGSINQLVRNVTQGPTGRLLDSFGDVAAARARQDILLGLVRGHNPRRIAQGLKKSLGVTQQRAFLIARTETQRAHRESIRQSYLRNSDTVDAWVWHAAASKRTCAACWALHGREFPLEQPMGAHPACRCSMVPKAKTWRELGFDVDETAAPIPAGSSIFADQDEATQRAVLGNKQYERYKNGDVRLEDFVRPQTNQWGTTYTKRVPN